MNYALFMVLGTFILSLATFMLVIVGIVNIYMMWWIKLTAST